MESTERKILKLFTYEKKLKFNELEKSLKIRSNKLAYHVKSMVNKKILVKSGEHYSLSEGSEYLIPYISEKVSVLPVVLIAMKRGRRVFLVERNKRPFKGKLALPASRLLLGESIEEGTKRILREKYGVNGSLERINSVSIEHVKKNGRTMHSFLLILVSAKTDDKIEYLDIEDVKKRIIKSDYLLMKHNLGKKIDIGTFYSTD